MENTPLQILIENKANETIKVAQQKYGRLWEAYEKSCTLLSRLAQQGEREADGESQFGSERLSLSVSVIQGCFIVERLISSGYYVASIAILRQHMETLARMIELRNGKKTNKTPNVSCLPFKLAQNYGGLSQIFHTARGEHLESFAEVADDERIASYLPEFREDWSNILLGMHIAHLVTLAKEIHILQFELYRQAPVTNNFDAEFRPIAEILVATGFWERFE